MWFTDEWSNAHVEKGPWKVTVSDKKYEKYKLLLPEWAAEAECQTAGKPSYEELLLILDQQLGRTFSYSSVVPT